MSLLSTTISRGVAASRPSAASVPVGSLYFSTDTLKLERNNGSSWDSYDLNPLTTQDDLIVAGASGVPGRLAKGTDGQVLTVDPSTHHLVWATPSSGFANPMTTAGDIIIGDTGGSPIRKAKGADSTVLTIDPGTHLPVWAAPSAGVFVGASVYSNANRSIGNNAFASIALDAENYDTDGFHDNATNNSRVTIPSGKDGYYRITGTFIFADNATGVRYARLFLNNTTQIDDTYAKPSGTGDAAYLRVMREIALVAGDYVELQAFQNSGGALNVLFSGVYTPRLDIHKIG